MWTFTQPLLQRLEHKISHSAVHTNTEIPFNSKHVTIKEEKTEQYVLKSGDI